MDKLNLDKKSLRKFGFTMAIAFIIISSFILIKHKQSPLTMAAISAAFLVLALASPNMLRPVYIIWMRLAFVLGWVNTRLILIIMFYFIFTPVSLIIKLLGIDLLDRKINRGRQTYWLENVKKNPDVSGYERQF